MKKIIGNVIVLVLAILGLSGCAKTGKETTVESGVKDQTRTVLKVGIEGTFPPFNYHEENGDLSGFEVELAKAVAEKLDRDIEFVETKWDSLIAGLDVEKYDVVFNNVAITEEREKKYDFSIPYAYSHATLAVTEDSKIKTLADFKDQKSAQTVSSNYAADAEALGAEVVPTDGFAQSIELVTSGRADGTINDDVTFLAYQKEKPDNNIRLIDEVIGTAKIAAIINKNHTQLKKEIDEALEALNAEGITSRLAITYFGKDITKE